ncbi:hypothetical protein KIF24_08295 [Micromonospora sp. Llam7]|uniref:hypothetical protein n=1 Tax=Micromonospora tarapacensis TaxID=2835305 RepID=UPI001C82A70D|nr:hypothetical protein [Micromonospora tarapacensis]MBX7264600.1 hypothetical protein [Micromonospora tarapacensis]MBX7266025.1 hypothetical protein [Micromonospora tarapacensis]
MRLFAILFLVLAPGEQDPNFESYGDLAAEREEYDARVYKAAVWFRSLPDAVIRRQRELIVRCPPHGCELAEVYRIDLPSGGQRYLFLGQAARCETVPGFLNWAFSDDWGGPVVWWPVGCRHGQAKLERAWLDDCLAFVNGWKHGLETIEEFLAKAPQEIRRGIARRTFHPKPEVWRPKLARRSGTRAVAFSLG